MIGESPLRKTTRYLLIECVDGTCELGGDHKKRYQQQNDTSITWTASIYETDSDTTNQIEADVLRNFLNSRPDALVLSPGSVSGLSLLATVGIILGCIIFLLLIILLCVLTVGMKTTKAAHEKIHRGGVDPYELL